MPQISAGLLIYRIRRPASSNRGKLAEDNSLEVLLVHPGGPHWSKKDEGFWGIPKGLIEDGENILQAAKRETEEETSWKTEGDFRPLGSIKQLSGKIVHAWAVEGDFDLNTFKSNTFEMEWPPESGQRQKFPEVDRAEYFDLATARKKILPAQAEFLDKLKQII